MQSILESVCSIHIFCFWGNAIVDISIDIDHSDKAGLTHLCVFICNLFFGHICICNFLLVSRGKVPGQNYLKFTEDVFLKSARY